MPRPSTIKTLPPEVLDEVNKLLRDEVAILDIVEHLKGLGFERSKSALDRYNQRVKAAGDRIKRSRMIAEQLAPHLGDAAVQGKTGRLLVDLVRSTVFDLMAVLDEAKDENGNPKPGFFNPQEIMMLGKGLAELSRAQRLDQDFETKIRDQIREEERRNAAEAVQSAGRECGMSDNQIGFVLGEILGVAVEGAPTDGHAHGQG